MPEGRLQDTGSITTAPDHRPGTVRHIVLFRYRDGLGDHEVMEVERRFHELATSPRGGAPYILGIESGDQNSPEGLGAGYHHAFIVTFASQGDRNYYVGAPVVRDPAHYDPMHHAFKEFVLPYLHADPGSALVFDFDV